MGTITTSSTTRPGPRWLQRTTAWQQYSDLLYLPIRSDREVLVRRTCLMPVCTKPFQPVRMEKQDWSNQLSKRASPTRIFTVRDTNNYLPANPTRPTGPTNYLLFKMRLLDIDRTFPFIYWGKLLPLFPIKNHYIIISMKWLYFYRKYTFLRRNWKCIKYEICR